MNSQPKTYSEAGKFYAVITLPNGYTYYSGPFNSRSAAYRYSIKESNKHKFASSHGFIYNTKGL